MVRQLDSDYQYTRLLDPKSIMNPGKVFTGGTMGTVMLIARAEPEAIISEPA